LLWTISKIAILHIYCHLSLLLCHFIIFNFLFFIDSTSLVCNSWFLIVNVDVDNIIFMKLLCPSIWNPILNFILKYFAVWIFGKGLIDTLFMKFIKFIIKLCNHVLDVLGLFFLIKLVNNCLFNIPFCNIYSLTCILSESLCDSFFS
jgi:hypothetical protein